MFQEKKLAQQALTEALKLRRQKGLSPQQAIDIFDFTRDLGIEVNFVDIPSMEAMYLKQKIPTILISYHRPPGRQVFNCAHELGHHIFGHGTKVDEYLENQQVRGITDSEEYLADRFASFFLMPNTTTRL